MKKNELIHVHALLVQVVEDLLDRGVVDPSHFDPYRELEVSPVDFRVRRDRHEEAVLLLASLVVEAIDQETDERETISAQ